VPYFTLVIPFVRHATGLGGGTLNPTPERKNSPRMNPNLNRHLPPYMPRQEALLLIWIKQFLNGLKPMLGLFQIEQQDYDQYVEGFGSLKNAYDNMLVKHT
jgi:hypothetical protein